MLTNAIGLKVYSQIQFLGLRVVVSLPLSKLLTGDAMMLLLPLQRKGEEEGEGKGGEGVREGEGEGKRGEGVREGEGEGRSGGQDIDHGE